MQQIRDEEGSPGGVLRKRDSGHFSIKHVLDEGVVLGYATCPTHQRSRGHFAPLKLRNCCKITLAAWPCG